MTITEIASSVGWHQHGQSWIWGVREQDGCEACDRAWKKMLALLRAAPKEQAPSLSLKEQLMSALSSRSKKSTKIASAKGTMNEPIAEQPMSRRDRLKAEAKARQGGLF